MAYRGADRNGKRMLELAIYVAAVVLGGYMVFFHQPLEEDTQVEVQGGKTDEDMAADYRNRELPDTDNETADESYAGEGTVSSRIYFSNTEELDAGNMPLEAQAVLTAGVQEFLNSNGYTDATELHISDKSYKEDGEKISFICSMSGYREAMQVEYVFDESCLKYYILPDGTDAGVEYEE